MDKIVNFDDILHQPALFLVENIDLLPRGRALDVAMGNGRNAIYLAKMGFQVEGVDASREAVEEALAHANEEGVSIQTREWKTSKRYPILTKRLMISSFASTISSGLLCPR